MNQNEVVDYWINTSKNDYKTAEVLFKSRRYSYSLFFCHLSVEKMLKAAVIKATNSAPPFTHDLIRLAEKAGLNLDSVRVGDLSEITTFNIETRYDDYKLSFYKKANRQFAQLYLIKSKEILKWIKKYV